MIATTAREPGSRAPENDATKLEAALIAAEDAIAALERLAAATGGNGQGAVLTPDVYGAIQGATSRARFARDYVVATRYRFDRGDLTLPEARLAGEPA